MKKNWKTLASKVVHKNPYYFIRRDRVIRPDGTKGFYYVVMNGPAVAIVALNKKNEVHLVELYRYTTKAFSLEVPIGGTDNQSPLKAAKRELAEEAGIVAKSWKLIGKVQTANGIMALWCYIFLATNLHKSTYNKQMEEGIQHVKIIPLRKALKMVKKGGITCGPSITALSLAAMERGLVRK